jgi:HNH endonuclease
MVRDGGCCSVPGCGSTAGLEVHHVQPWYWGGKTVMSNLTVLCRAHHHAVHEHVFWIVSLGKERFRFVLPDGREIPKHVDPGAHARGRSLEEEDSHVHPSAATTRRDGSRLDREYAIAALAQDLKSTRSWRERLARITAAQKPAFDPWALSAAVGS